MRKDGAHNEIAVMGGCDETDECIAIIVIRNPLTWDMAEYHADVEMLEILIDRLIDRL